MPPHKTVKEWRRDMDGLREDRLQLWASEIDGNSDVCWTRRIIRSFVSHPQLYHKLDKWLVKRKSRTESDPVNNKEPTSDEVWEKAHDIVRRREGQASRNKSLNHAHTRSRIMRALLRWTQLLHQARASQFLSSQRGAYGSGASDLVRFRHQKHVSHTYITWHLSTRKHLLLQVKCDPNFISVGTRPWIQRNMEPAKLWVPNQMVFNSKLPTPIPGQHLQTLVHGQCVPGVS